MEEHKPKKSTKGNKLVGHIDDYTDADVAALEKRLEGMTREEARAYAANFGDPSVDYSKVDFSKPEE
jgi:hypothetical protein